MKYCCLFLLIWPASIVQAQSSAAGGVALFSGPELGMRRAESTAENEPYVRAHITDSREPGPDSGGPHPASLVDQMKIVTALSALATTKETVPFWMRSNRYGNIPLDGISVGLYGGVEKDFADDKDNLVDWGGSLSGQLNVGHSVRFNLIEAYLKARLSIFQLKIGRSKDFMGFVDSTLSSGSFAISGNAAGIPKIELSLPEFWNFPFTRGWIAFKGNFALGYIGSLSTERNRSMPGVLAETYYHQKSLYGRFGKPNWIVKLYGGFNHQIFWGDENKYFNSWNLSPFKTAMKALTGGTYKGSKVGNHLGSLDQGIELQLKKVAITAYHQFFYDVGGLYHLNNVKDGLWGVSFNNTSELNEGGLGWRKILIEFLYTKSQGGELDAKVTPSGDENYYNGMYAEDWTYRRENLGSPLLTSRKYARADLPTGSDHDYFINNRVIAFHAGLEGNILQWICTLKLTYSYNYGTYSSSPIGRSGSTTRTPGIPPYFSMVRQFSGYMEASRPLKNNFNLGIALAVDQGGLLYNSVGGFIKLTRIW